MLLKDKLAYSPKEVSQLLGIGVRAAYDLCHRADFPCIRIGTRMVIPADNLQRWLDAQTTQE